MAENKHAWQAINFRADEITAEHGDTISIAGDSQVEVVDRLVYQCDELDELIHDFPQAIKDEASVWVYYPWRRCIVRCLGPQAFKRLRSDRNRNKITAQEQAALATKTIAVIGLSVGHAVAYTLAQEGLCGTLRLADHDDLSLSNLNRIPADILDIGLPKTIVLARRIAEIDPYLKLEIIPQGMTAQTIDTLFDGTDLVIDECDSIDIKFAMRFKAKELGVPIMMQTSDGGVLDIERFDLEADRPVFHGLTTVSDLQQLAGLSNADKVPMVMGILEASKVSSRLAASLMEIDEMLTTWPQLASDISFGAGMVGAAVRRWGLGQELRSGRLRLDMDQGLDQIQSPEPALAKTVAEPAVERAASFKDEVLLAASRAPSGGNVQPWRFDINDKNFAVYLDPERSSLMDIKLRGSLLAVGAALFNAEVTLAAAGKTGRLNLCDKELSHGQRQGREPVAELSFGDSEVPELPELPELAELAELAGYVDQRACTRLRGQSAAISPQWQQLAEQWAESEGGQAVFLRTEALQQAADIWAEADRIRFLTPKLHHEMMSELSFPGDDLRRGIDIRTLELSEKDEVALNVARRSDAMQELAGWEGGKRLGESSRNLLNDADAMLVLTAAGRSDVDYLKAGRLLQRIWLQATHDKVGLHPMSPLFLYATSPSDLVGRVAPGDVQKMWQLRVEFAALCGLAPEQPLALTLRATSVMHVSVRSHRELIKDRLIDSKIQANRDLESLR